MMTTSNEHNNAPAVPQGEPEAYMVYGNYTRQPFRSIESAQAYRGGLLKSDPEGGYHIRPLFYATPAAPSQPAVPSVLKRGYGRLIQAAADLALQQFMPSDIVDDYPSKTISAAKVAKMMTQPRDRLRLLSIEVSEGAKQMLAATPAAPSQEHAVNLSCRSTQARLAAQWGYVPAPSQPAVPQGEPVYQLARATGPVADAWIDVAKDVYDDAGFHPSDFKRRILYAAPSQPVTLTDEEIEAIAKKHMSTVGDHWSNEEAIREIHAEDFARAIIAALRAKESK